jgi:protein quaking
MFLYAPFVACKIRITFNKILSFPEINRVRVTIFQCEFATEPLVLPDAAGEIVTRQEKVFVPTKEYPEYNFVGRILGPRGMTAKQLETETGCKIMVRGKGSMRDKKKVSF